MMAISPGFLFGTFGFKHAEISAFKREDEAILTKNLFLELGSAIWNHLWTYGSYWQKLILHGELRIQVAGCIQGTVLK